MSEKPGWRGLADDLVRVHFITFAVIGGLAACGTAVWIWWAQAWNMPPPVIALLGLAAFVLLFVLWYFLAIIGNKYFGVPAVHPLYPTKQAALYSPPSPVSAPTTERSRAIAELPSPRPAGAVTVAGQPDRIFVNKTPKETADLVRELTSIRAADVAKRYIGKWMRLAGPISNVVAESWVSVLMIWGSKTAVTLRFHPDWLAQLEHLGPEEIVAAEGQIKRIEILYPGTVGITLENCEVIELASVPSACVWPSPGSTP